MKIRSLAILFLIMAFYLFGQNASKPVFEKALNKYFATKPVYLTDQIKGQVFQKFPIEIKELNINDQFSIYVEKFAKVGLLDRNERKEIITKQNQKGQNVEEEIIIYVYTLSEKGKKYYKHKISHDAFYGTISGFKYGDMKIKKILNFTKPSEMWGYTYSTVMFTYIVNITGDWVTDEVFRNEENVEEHLNSIKEPIESQEALILTDEGWIVNKK